VLNTIFIVTLKFPRDELLDELLLELEDDLDDEEDSDDEEDPDDELDDELLREDDDLLDMLDALLETELLELPELSELMLLDDDFELPELEDLLDNELAELPLDMLRLDELMLEELDKLDDGVEALDWDEADDSDTDMLDDELFRMSAMSAETVR
jgi:hypothetical protein